MAKRQKLAAAELADFLEGAAASDSFAAELGLGEAADASAQGEPCHTTQATMDAASLTEACAFLSHALLGGSGEAARLLAEAAEEVERESWLPDAALMVRCCGRECLKTLYWGVCAGGVCTEAGGGEEEEGGTERVPCSAPEPGYVGVRPEDRRKVYVGGRA